MRLRSAATLLLAVAPLMLLTACGSKQPNTSTVSTAPMKLAVGQGAAAPGGGSFLNAPIPTAVLSLSLFDSNGKSFTLGSLHGKSVVIASFLTSCQEICPMIAVDLRQIGDLIAASPLTGKIVVMALSVDSRRDKVGRLAAYAKIFDDPNFTVASGLESSLAPFWKFFGTSYSIVPYSPAQMKALPLDWQTGKMNTFDVSHTDEVLIVNPSGSWAWLDLGTPALSKTTIPDQLKKYLSTDGLNNLAKPQEPNWGVPAVLSALSTISGTKISLSNN